MTTSQLSADFSTLILSIGQSVYHELGYEGPEKKNPEKLNPEVARYNIDLLELLQTKTKGNLTKDEEKLLEAILYDARMKFLECMKK